MKRVTVSDAAREAIAAVLDTAKKVQLVNEQIAEAVKNGQKIENSWNAYVFGGLEQINDFMTAVDSLEDDEPEPKKGPKK